MIAIIPARGGSVRIPNKNIKEFQGKPIIQYSIDTAEKSGLFDKIIISTESTEIEKLVRKKYEIEFYGDFNSRWSEMPKHINIHNRSDELAINEVGTQEVVKNVIQELKIKDEFICCIYPTSPLLSAEDLSKGLMLLKSNRNIQHSFSVGTNPLRDAGNFYWSRREAVLSNVEVHGEHSIMVPIDESRVCDINTPEDWAEAEEKYRRLHGRP